MVTLSFMKGIQHCESPHFSAAKPQAWMQRQNEVGVYICVYFQKQKLKLLSLNQAINADNHASLLNAR